MKIKPMVERRDSTHFPIWIHDDAGACIALSWVEAARLVGELSAEIQDYDLEREDQARMEVRAAQMIATTATIPPVPAS